MCVLNRDQIIDYAVDELYDVLKMDIPAQIRKKLVSVTDAVQCFSLGMGVVCEYGERCTEGELCNPVQNIRPKN